VADFSVNLAAPQGAGANVIAPVQDIGSDNKILTGIVDIFAKGLAQGQKDKALERKNAVIGEYVKNESIYSDALVTGQWGAAQVGAASRANFQKMQASYPEYITELMEARKGVYDGTETGEAQKKVDSEIKFKQEEKARASAAGFVFYDGMSADAEAKTISASQTSIRLGKEFDEITKRKAEERAAAAEGRATQSHMITLQDHQDKETAVKGLLEIADRNYDALSAMGNDLINNPTMPFEEKQALFNSNVRRIKTGLLSISAKNPEMAAPWQRLIDDMEGTFTKLADPKPKVEGELAMLKAQFDAQQYKAKLLITADPKNRAAVATASLFPNNPQVNVAMTPVVSGILADYGLGPEQGKKKTPVVGTPNEKEALKSIKGALNLLQTGKANGDPVRNKAEAVNTINEILQQTGAMETGVPPAQLKELSSFYASPEFGKLSSEGKVDMPSMQNAKRVFQVAYEPAVRDAIEARLKEAMTLSRIDIQMSGGSVVFNTKAPSDKRSFGEQLSGALNIEAGMAGNESNASVAALKDAAGGLNTLIKMGAHMEGTTDYNKYWEANKHYLLPTVFPDPAKLKVGDVVKGYKYMGGAYGDQANWQRVK
jgi:hypothetical protein